MFFLIRSFHSISILLKSDSQSVSQSVSQLPLTSSEVRAMDADVSMGNSACSVFGMFSKQRTSKMMHKRRHGTHGEDSHYESQWTRKITAQITEAI